MANLEEVMRREIQKALDKTANVIKKKIDDYIQRWYDDYKPSQYQRTEMFKKSCVRTSVYPKGKDSYGVTVYIDEQHMRHQFEMSGLTERHILDAANQGLHGATVPGHYEYGDTRVKFWNDAIEELRESDWKLLMDELHKYLKHEGYHIVITNRLNNKSDEYDI